MEQKMEETRDRERREETINYRHRALPSAALTNDLAHLQLVAVIVTIIILCVVARHEILYSL